MISNIEMACIENGIYENKELRAFILMQTFKPTKYITLNENESNIKGVRYDKKRNKWIAAYRTEGAYETDIIKPTFKRFDTKQEAEEYMYQYRKDMLKKLIKKYPKYFVKNTLKRRVESGRAGYAKEDMYFDVISKLTDDEIIDIIIKKDSLERKYL